MHSLEDTNVDEALSMNREILIRVKSMTPWFHVKSQCWSPADFIATSAKAIAGQFRIVELQQLRAGKNVSRLVA